MACVHLHGVSLRDLELRLVVARNVHVPEPLRGPGGAHRGAGPPNADEVLRLLRAVGIPVLEVPRGQIRIGQNVLPLTRQTALLRLKRGEEVTVELLENGQTLGFKRFIVPEEGDCVWKLAKK